MDGREYLELAHAHPLPAAQYLRQRFEGRVVSFRLDGFVVSGTCAAVLEEGTFLLTFVDWFEHRRGRDLGHGGPPWSHSARLTARLSELHEVEIHLQEVRMGRFGPTFSPRG